VPNLISIFRCLGRARDSVLVRGCVIRLVTRVFTGGGGWVTSPPTPSCRTTTCRQSATAFSIYSQLLSIFGGRLLHPQPEDAPCRRDRGPT
jgi:hypothetical protein